MILPKIANGKGRTLLIRLVLNGLMQATATVAAALLIKLTFDRFIITDEPLPGYMLAWIGLGLLAVAIGIAWLRMMERIDAERLGQDYIHQLRLKLYRHMSKMPPRTLQRRSHGSVVLRFIGDLSAIRQWISLGLARLTVASVIITGTLLVLAILNWVLALTVGVVLTAGALLALALGKPMQTAVKEARRRRSYLAGNINEKVASMAVVQLCGQTHREHNRIDRQSQRLKNAMISRARVIGALRAVTEGTTAIATGGALLLGTMVVASGHATPGMVVAAMSLVGMLVPPLRDLGRVYEYWHGAQVSGQKIQQFLSLPTRSTASSKGIRLSEAGPGRLKFKDVSVYGSLENFSACAEPGTVVALVGPNGSGKSTLLSLAAHLVEADQGTVHLDGRRITKISPKSYRRMIGMVSADLPLLRGTIDKNLRYRWPGAPDDEVRRVRALCGIDEFLAELPAGDKTRLTDGAANLSLGQRQRIALARAILGNPRVLLLDEANSNLDPAASAIFNRIIANYEGTVLLATHHLEQVNTADVVWHLQDGRLIESGAPGDLLHSGGATSHLFSHKHKLAS